jgi:hypothetical protein
MKKGGVPVVGSYSISGKNYQCKDDNCLMMIDIGRANNLYGVSYFWTLI